MADQKITQLTEDTSPSPADLVKTVKDPAGTPLDRKVTLLNLVKGALSGIWTPASSSGPASFALHEDTDNGSNKGTLIAPAAIGADRTWTMPDATGTVALAETIAATYQQIQSSIFVPAGNFGSVAGSPALGDAGLDVPSWLLDSASTERVATILALPVAWSTFDIIIVWTNAGAGSGNVHWDTAYSPGFGDGESVAHSTFATDQDVAAPAQNTAKFTTMATGAAAPSAGELLPIRVGRAGGNAGDTLGNDCGFLGVRLVKAS